MPEEVRCLECGKVRTDEPEYSAIQVIMGLPIGWYSGEDGEICPDDMDRVLRRSQR